MKPNHHTCSDGIGDMATYSRFRPPMGINKKGSLKSDQATAIALNFG